MQASAPKLDRTRRLHKRGRWTGFFYILPWLIGFAVFQPGNRIGNTHTHCRAILNKTTFYVLYQIQKHGVIYRQRTLRKTFSGE